MILQIYSDKPSPRLDYILKQLFTQVLGIEYKLFHSIESVNLEDPILNYSHTEIPKSFQIRPHSLLFEDDIHPQTIKIEDSFYFFRSSNTNFLYDIFASSFFMLSRYEEYLETDLDSHGRFQAESSLAYKNNFLDKAVVNRWADELKKEILSRFPLLSFKKQEYQYLSTIDIDNAFAFKSKGIKRLLGGFAKAILRKDYEDVKARFQYLFLGKKDPFDVYNYLNQVHQKYRIKTLYFFLIGKNSKYDKNISIRQADYKNLIRKISKVSEIGIHPSYQSNSSFDILKTEINDLENVSKKSITKSRQHFLKLSLPKTYQNLITAGIKEDYTMGFASQLGFRAGICNVYYWFDLERNSETDLKIFPFQIMDGTLNDYLQKKPTDSLSLIKNINSEVRFVKGLFITLWHNESLSELRRWKDWKYVYADLLKIATE